MNVVHLIDSLNSGGAERMAVTFANSLVGKVDGSFLCVTRSEGHLKGTINPKVGYVFLNRQRIIDITALKAFLKFIRKNNIDIIHAHSSSFFFAVLTKFFYKSIILVWHDHYGDRKNTNFFQKFILKFCSRYFSFIFCASKKMQKWLTTFLKEDEVEYLSNYPVIISETNKTQLKGVDGKRILCLANLRPDKDHLNLLSAFKNIVTEYSEWSLHLVGHDANDDYSSEIKEYILSNDLKNKVFVYGSRQDVNNILSQSNIGVLTSKSEGLPLSLLEYGIAKLAVVVTDVGQCGEIIDLDDYGLLIEPRNSIATQKAIVKLIENESFRLSLGEKLQKKIKKEYSEESITNKLVGVYKVQLELSGR